MCKSIQRGIIPATKGFEKPNDMINGSLPLNLAAQETHLHREDLLAVSASGWGGVNSHIILGFPDARVHKQTSTSFDNIFQRETLAAPRLRLGNPTSSDSETGSIDSTVVSSFSNYASKILGCDIQPETNLKEHGLDSLAYVALSKSVAADLSTAPVE